MFWRRNSALPSGVLLPTIKMKLAREIYLDQPAQAFGMDGLGPVDFDRASRCGHRDIGHPRRLNPVT
ncbi:hypothetical protein AC519_5474 [Pseudomonas savastanoi]|nr:hypothetical protein AC519_5474 [Pseudomonas savastanoi]